jgi:hypothetical protein
MTTPEEPLPGDAVAAALLQITQHAERLALLDNRETQHHNQIAERLRELAAQLSGITTHVDGLAARVTAIAGQLPEYADDDDQQPPPYQPIPPPQWWKLTPSQHEEAIARLRAWIEMIYLPGYGRLAATLPPCWDQHPLCLYTLDWLAELWSVLYLSPQRTAGSLAAQAEWQTRLLPAAAEQMATETANCEHGLGGSRRPSPIATHLNRP